jgi:hypothetical protein
MSNSILEPPMRGTPARCLRWVIAMMDPDDPDLAAAVLFLAEALGPGGLSLDHNREAFEIFARVHGQWAAGTLDAQRAGLDVSRTLSTRQSVRACARERDCLVPVACACLWCGKAFRPPGVVGKRFCSDRCRAAFHRGCRLWAMQAVAEGRLSMEAVRDASRSPYTGILGPSALSAAAGEAGR